MAPWGQHKDTAVKLHVTLLDGREYMYEAMPHDTIAAIKVHLEFETRIEAEFEVDGPKGKTEKKEKGKKEKKEKPIENMSLWLGGLGRPHRLKNGETIQVGVVQEMEHVTKRPAPSPVTLRLMTKFELDSLDNKDQLGNTLLHRAIMDSNPERARARCACLCEVGSDVNLPNHIGDTPLLIAVSMGLVECARALLEAKADITTANEAGFTPLLIAASDGASELVELISRKIELRSADLNEKAGGYSALHWLCMKGDHASVKVLLEHGADPNTSASPGLTNGGTPMVKAAQFSFVECCKALRSHGALLDVRDRHGRNALHYAARNGSLETLAVLLSPVPGRSGPQRQTDLSGALNATDGAGRTPTTYAVQARALACIELLQSTPGAKHDKAAHDELDGMRRTMAEEDRAAAAGGQTTESLKGCSFLCDVVLCGGDTSIPG